MIYIRHHLTLALFAFIMLATPTYGQVIDRSLCDQCLTTSKAELQRCLEAAISQEDKKFCQVKQDTHMKNCENECKIEKAAQSGNKSEAIPAKK